MLRYLSSNSPRLRLEEDKDSGLHQDNKHNVNQQRYNVCCRNQTSTRSLLYQLMVRTGPTHYSINKLDRFIDRCKSLNYCSQTTSHIAQLFHLISNSHHVLQRLHLTIKYQCITLDHNLTLTSKSLCIFLYFVYFVKCLYNNCNFITRMLFKGTY